MNVIVRMMTTILVVGTCYAKSSVSSSRPSSFRSSSVSRPSAPTFHPTTSTKSTTTKSPTVSPSHISESSTSHSETTPAPVKTTKPIVSTVNNIHTEEKTSQSIRPRVVVIHNYNSWSSHPYYQTGFWGYHPFTYWSPFSYWSRPSIVYHPVRYLCENPGSNSVIQSSSSWNSPENELVDGPESSTFVPIKPQ